MKQRSRLMRWSLRQLLIFFLLISLGLTWMLITLSFSLYRNAMRSNTEKSIDLYVSSIEKQLKDELQSVRTAMYTLTNKREIMDYVSNNRGYKAANVKYITARMDSMHSFVPAVDDILLAISPNSVVSSTNNRGDIVNFLIRYDIVQRYFRESSGNTAVYSIPTEVSGQYILTMVIPVTSSMKTSALFAFMTAESLIGSFSFASGPFEIRLGDKIIYAVRELNPDIETVNISAVLPGWTITVPIPLQQEDTHAVTMYRWSMISIVIFGVIESLMICGIYSVIIAPICGISTQIAQINSYTNVIAHPATGRNEITTLVENINSMMQRTNQLTREMNDAQVRLMEMEIHNLQARIMSLQAQINPHFLYNMLECICGMAAQRGNKEIRETAQLLARLYQYCLKSPDATVGEELKSLTLYERIINIRYGKQFRIEINVPEDLTLMPMPRMALEPIVENAVQHGFVCGNGQIFFVSIYGELSDDVLHMKIADNGCGMTDLQLKELNTRLANPIFDTARNEGRIGLNNVAARIKLVYGSNSSLCAERNRWGGVTIHMKIHYGEVI